MERGIELCLAADVELRHRCVLPLIVRTDDRVFPVFLFDTLSCLWNNLVKPHATQKHMTRNPPSDISRLRRSRNPRIATVVTARGRDTPDAQRAEAPEGVADSEPEADEQATGPSGESSSSECEAVDIVRRTEDAIRNLLTDENRDPEEDARLSELADRLAALALRARAPQKLQPPRPALGCRHPYFRVDDDRLVKVGWSKKHSREYEHRSPRHEAEAVTVHLGANTAHDVPFRFDQHLPVRDRDGEALPQYVAYLALAWLRQAGAVDKLGRNVFRRIADPLDARVFDALWKNTRQR